MTSKIKLNFPRNFTSINFILSPIQVNFIVYLYSCCFLFLAFVQNLRYRVSPVFLAKQRQYLPQAPGFSLFFPFQFLVTESFFFLAVISGVTNGGKSGGGGVGCGKLFRKLSICGSGRCPVSSEKSK